MKFKLEFPFLVYTRKMKVRRQLSADQVDVDLLPSSWNP